MITNPISANQVVDVNIDLNCLLIQGSCKTLPFVLQAIVDKVCEVTPPSDVLDLDYDCFTVPADQKEFNQQLIDKICTLESRVDTSNTCVFNYCASDNWDCSIRDTCLIVENPCNPLVITVCDVVQALIRRAVSQGDVIIDLCQRVTTLEDRVDLLQTQLNIIQATCCNV